LLGLGGIFTEALKDVTFAAAPLSAAEARRMVAALRARDVLTRPFRGEPAVDLDALAALLVGLGRLAVERPDVAGVDLNPLIIREGRPVAVDALVVLDQGPPPSVPPRPLPDGAAMRARLAPLFEPRGVIVAGASSHPGKFGFVAYHNLLRFDFLGEVFAVNREGAEILGRPSLPDVGAVPAGRAARVVVCTPTRGSAALRRDCAARGVRAAFVASGGYRESGAEGAALEAELVHTADDLGMVLAGPNGQGLISTSRSLCAQI